MHLEEKVFQALSCQPTSEKFSSKDSWGTGAADREVADVDATALELRPRRLEPHAPPPRGGSPGRYRGPCSRCSSRLAPAAAHGRVTPAVARQQARRHHVLCRNSAAAARARCRCRSCRRRRPALATLRHAACRAVRCQDQDLQRKERRRSRGSTTGR